MIGGGGVRSDPIILNTHRAFARAFVEGEEKWHWLVPSVWCGSGEFRGQVDHVHVEGGGRMKADVYYLGTARADLAMACPSVAQRLLGAQIRGALLFWLN